MVAEEQSINSMCMSMSMSINSITESTEYAPKNYKMLTISIL